MGRRVGRNHRGASTLMLACSGGALVVYVLLIGLFVAGVGDPEIR